MKDSELTYDPAAGTVGLLTYPEYERFTRAVTDALKHIPWWRIAGQLSAGDADEYKPRSSDPTIPLPATWLAAEEISNLLQEINHWETLEDVARFGHEFALTITREVETAMHKWPMEDRPHKVQFLRCRECQQVSLKYYPPKSAGSDMTIKCTNPNCRAIEDPRNFAHDAALIQEENEIAKRRLGDRKRRTSKSEPHETDGVLVGAAGEGEDDATRANVVAVPA